MRTATMIWGTSSRRAGYRLGTSASCLLTALAFAGACSGGADSASNTDTPPTVGEPDHPENGSLSVDEGRLSAVVVGADLRLELPVSATKGGSGELEVSVVLVDGSKTFQTTRVAYDLVAGERAVLQAVLSVPAEIATQADWVRYNVLIRDAAKSALRVTSSLLRVVKPYSLRLEGPGTVSRSKAASYRVRAEHPVTKAPLAGVDVALDFKKGDESVRTLTGTTSTTGDVIFPVVLDDVGSLDVQATAKTQGTTADVGHPVTVAEPGKKVLVTTDKPLYQPGQTVHLRALALAPPQNTPVAGSSAVLEVSDGKGNTVFHREVTTDAYGVASAVFNIGPIVNEGTYKTTVAIGSDRTEKTFTVSHYVLPKFGIDLGVDKTWYSAGDAVQGTLDAEYFFGKPVATASVVVEAFTLDVGESVFQKVVGKTDGDGKMTFALSLPSSLVGLPLEQGNATFGVRVTVTDTAGQAVVKELSGTVAADGVRVTVVPESTTLVPGLENRIQVFANDPLGAPVASAEVSVDTGSGSLTGTTDAYGSVELHFVPAAAAQTFTLRTTVTPSGGKPLVKTVTFGAQAGDEHVLVRADKAVYDVGDTVTVRILASSNAVHAYADWLNEGQAVDMRTLDLEKGEGTFTMTLDGSFLGSNRIEAYIVDDGGNVVRAGQTVFVRGDSALDVTVEPDKASYLPGEPAKLQFSVKDAEGKPAVAAIGVQIVDEAVFGLVDAQPGLLKSYFELEDAYSKPTYEIEAPAASLSSLLFQHSDDVAASAASDRKAQAVFAAMGSASVSGIQETSWTKVDVAAKANLKVFFDSSKAAIASTAKAAAILALKAIEKNGCTLDAYYCDATGKSALQMISDELATRLSVVDFWGNVFVSKSVGGYPSLVDLTTNGPDELPGTSDDAILSLTASDVDLSGAFQSVTGSDAGASAGPIFGGGFPVSGGSSAGGATSTGPLPTDSSTSAGPRVRRSFPETLYVNPEIITGADGTASVDVGMADSITSFRISMLASTLGGKLGGGQGGLTVFQDFFADVNFPATLTRGDEVEFPVAVYNYLKTAQTVHLSLDAGDWYTPLGPATLDVALAAGEVKGVRFPVRVDHVGLKTLTVRATGTKASDAVARTVNVVPDGKAFPGSHSGALGAAPVTETVSFPPLAIAGSEKLYLTVYPGYLSQVVQGMDSLLQVPNGCFEQTTSTTWPNVLAMNYMTSTKQVTPEIQLKAESYIDAGYQRLLTFEHPGGGFSWFGTQDPAPFLSVTALGLMEFSDMAKVHPMDAAMIERTRAWLAAQQAPDGSWTGDRSEFFSVQTGAVRNTAFVIWSLASAGYTGSEIGRGLDYVKAQLGGDADPYTLGIVANAFAMAAPSDPFEATVLETLDEAKKTDGTKMSWDTASTQTNFYASGSDGAVATTGIVASAFLNAGGYTATVKGALEFLSASKDAAGNFGSTQATVWALRALLLAAGKGTEVAVGSLAVNVDGAPFTQVPLTKAQGDVMTTIDLSSLAKTGSHQVELAFTGSGQVSYNLVDGYNLLWKDTPKESPLPLAVSVAYDKTSLQLNETVQATVTVTNTTPQDENMVLVTVGIPPGFALSTDDLDAYRLSGVLSQYELTEKQLTLYLTKLAPKAVQAFQYRLVATMPVKASDGGAQAYLYYQPADKAAAASTQIQVTGG